MCFFYETKFPGQTINFCISFLKAIVLRVQLGYLGTLYAQLCILWPISFFVTSWARTAWTNWNLVICQGQIPEREWKKSIPKIRKRESEASISGNGNSQSPLINDYDIEYCISDWQSEGDMDWTAFAFLAMFFSGCLFSREKRFWFNIFAFSVLISAKCLLCSLAKVSEFHIIKISTSSDFNKM